MALYALNLFDLADNDLYRRYSLREGGTEDYLWWTYERLEDLRPVFQDIRGSS